MQLAMKAFAQKQHGHPIDMKIIAATRASAYGRGHAGYYKQANPNDKRGQHCVHLWRNTVNHPHAGNIQQDNAEQPQPPPADPGECPPVCPYIFFRAPHRIPCINQRFPPFRQMVLQGVTARQEPLLNKRTIPACFRVSYSALHHNLPESGAGSHTYENLLNTAWIAGKIRATT